MAESGFKDYAVSQWYGIYAPAATPRDIQAKVIAATRAALAKANVQKQITDMGMDLTNELQNDFKSFDRAERTKWAGFLKAGSPTAK
jgi:tripartite-type tricarboxylate transporter receptor subunit TctC